MPSTSTDLREPALAFIMALSDPSLTLAEATWEGVMLVEVLWDVDQARARKLMERLQALRRAGQVVKPASPQLPTAPA